MKKVTIKSRFRDKDDYKVIYNPGEVKEFDDARAESLIARGLVIPIDAAEEKTEDADTPAPKAKGKKGKSTKKKDDTPADSTDGDAAADDADAKDAEDAETETDTTIPDKDKP